MFSYTLKKDGKQIRKGWISEKAFETFLRIHGADEMVLKMPVVEVLDDQTAQEAEGKKDD